MENEGHQQMFSLCNNEREEIVINLESSIFDIAASLLKTKSSTSSSEIEEDLELPNSLNSSDDSYDSDESYQSYITARDEMEEFDDFYGRKSGRFTVGGFPQDENVYVAVGKGQSSMDALSWTLNNCINPSTNIFLIHVLPETRYIPSPLGLVRNQNVSATIVDKYKNQERNKAKAFLQKILDACSSSFDIQNKVDVVLVESDAVGKTLVNLITFLKINKLVVGTHATKTGGSRMTKYKKNGIAHKIIMKAPKTCEVKLVCGGKEVTDPIFATPFLSPSSSQRVDSEISLASPCLSFRSSSSKLSWFKKSKSYADFQKREMKMEKSKSYSDFQKREMKMEKSKSDSDFQNPGVKMEKSKSYDTDLEKMEKSRSYRDFHIPKMKFHPAQMCST